MRNQRIVGGVASLALLLVGGCDGRSVVGSASSATAAATVTVTVTSRTTAPASTGDGRSGGPGPSTTSCTDVTVADPSTRFEPSLRDGDTLTVSDTGWLDGPADPRQITVTEGSEVVRLKQKSTATRSGCGTVMSSQTWLEVTAQRTGEVRLTFNAFDGTKNLRITVIKR